MTRVWLEGRDMDMSLGARLGEGSQLRLREVEKRVKKVEMYKKHRREDYLKRELVHA